MNFIQVNSIEDNKQFRQFLKENLDGRLFELVLYREENGKLNPRTVKAFPVQADTCKLFQDGTAIGIGFNGRALLLQCVGKEKIQAVNNSKKTLEDGLQKIEDVLGNVPVVEELRQDIHKFMESISSMFDYTNEE